MNEKPSISLKQIKKTISKHHSFIFIIVACLGLAAVIYSLYDVMNMADTNSVSTTSSISGFDQATIEKIKTLHVSSDTSGSKVNLPCPRQAIFTEQHIRCLDWFSSQLADYRTANNGNIPSSTTLCTFVKTYLDGTNCTTASKKYTDDQGTPYTIQYHYTPKASNEIGYWDSSLCSAQSANGVTASGDPHQYALVTFQADHPLVCVDNK